MKCSICKKESKELQSTGDRIRLFFFHFFHEDIIDLSSDQFTKGFGEGYIAGYAKATEHRNTNQISVLQRWNLHEK